MRRRSFLTCLCISPLAFACRGDRPQPTSPSEGATNVFVFARFHAREGQEDGLAAVLREQVDGVRTEPGCREIRAHRSIRDARLFYIFARWSDENALDQHVALPRTGSFVDRVEALIDHPFDITRARRIEE